MPISIGIFTARHSLDNIRSVESEMRKYCKITYFPYDTLTELAHLYEKHSFRFDGILFSGPVPRDYITENIGPIVKPAQSLDLTSRDYYLTVARLFASNPGLDFSRVYFDSASDPSVFRPILRNDQLPLLPSAQSKSQYKANLRLAMYNRYMNLYRSMWQKGQCDIIVTRFTNLANRLETEHIPHVLLLPCPETIIDYFHALMNDIRDAACQNALNACCIIKPDGESPAPDVFSRLEKLLTAVGHSHDCNFLIRRNSAHLEVITSAMEVKKLTCGYSSCFFSEKLQNQVSSPLTIGWGIGFDAVSAYRNAKKALLSSQKDRNHFAYLVTEAQEMVGPLADNRSISYDLRPDARVSSLARSLKIAPINLEKLISLHDTRGMHEFTSADLVYFLGITQRSASRILQKLTDARLAHPVRNINLSGTGRPAIVYEVDFEALH